MAMTASLARNAPKEDRVRANTAPEVNHQIDTDLERRIRFYATQDERTISERIEELNREWDIERAIETNAASLSLLGLVFGMTRNRLWFLLPVTVAAFLLRHGIQGWCPPVPVLRRLGFRTRIEIERERYAMKILRGDFDQIKPAEEGHLRDSDQVADAVRK